MKKNISISCLDDQKQLLSNFSSKITAYITIWGQKYEHHGIHGH